MAPKDTNGVDELSSSTPPTSAENKNSVAGKAGLSVRARRFVGIGLLAVLGPLIALTLGVYIYLSGGRFVTTDNAYVKSDKIAVSSDVAGRVQTVAVRENELVEAGALLFKIDPAPFQIALDRAEARLLAARQRVDALRAIYHQKHAALKRNQSEVEYHLMQYERQVKLSRKNLVSGMNLDTATRNLRDARDQVKLAEQGLEEARAKLGGDPSIPVASHPEVLEATAVRDQAALDHQRTEVHAPMRGIVTNFDLQSGEYVKAGAPIFSLIGADRTWVHANFKETELTHVRVGQPATISIDTYPDRVFKATVAGISPATGAEFALLPPQNATGNWVKVVQRLTVRLKLADAQPVDAKLDAGQAPMLRAGMSAIVEIDTGHKRKLHGMFAIVGDWASGLAKGIL